MVMADSVMLVPSKTNTLIQVTSASAQQLSNGQGDIYVGRTNQDGQGPATISIRRGLVEFDIADNIPAGAAITGVTLTVDDVRGLNGDQVVSLYPMLRDWGQGSSFFDGGAGAPATQGDATWYYTFYNASNPSASPMWSAPGGQQGVDFGASSSGTSLIISTGTANLSFSWSNTSSGNSALVTDVQRWLDSPGTNFGWIMLGNESIGQTAKRFGGQSAVAPEAPPELTIQYTYAPWIWTGGAGNGVWTSLCNWASGVPNSDGAAVVFSASASAPLSITLNSPQTVGTLVLGSGTAGLGYTFSGSGGNTLTFSNTGNAASAQISVTDGAHLIDAPVVLDSSLVVTSTSSNSWTLSFGTAGNITDKGRNSSLTMSASNGTLILSGSDNYTGGTLVTAGTLGITSPHALPRGRSLMVGGDGIFIYDPSLVATQGRAANDASSRGAAIEAVPEPGTLALLGAAAIVAVAAVWRRFGRA